MQTQRNHPDLTEMIDLIGRDRVSPGVHEHVLSCVVCTRAMEELVQIAVAIFEAQPCRDASAELRARTMAAAGFRPPTPTRARARAGSAARAGSG